MGAGLLRQGFTEEALPHLRESLASYRSTGLRDFADALSQYSG